MDKQAREAKEQMKSLSPKEKWTNFWYYYKVHVFAAIFIIAVVAVTAVECAKRVDYDLNISYYSSTAISDDGIEKLKELFATCTKDIDYNGSVDVGIVSCFANPEEANEQTQAVFVKLAAELAAGDSMGYILDESYKEIFLRSYSDTVDTILEIDTVPEVRDALGLAGGQKLYWITKTLYDREKDKDTSAAEHQNAVDVQNLLIEKGAVRQ